MKTVRELRERDKFEATYFDTVTKIREFVQRCQLILTDVRSAETASISSSHGSQTASADINNLLSLTVLI